MGSLQEKVLDKLREAGLSEPAKDTFLRNFELLLEGVEPFIRESEVEPCENIIKLEELPPYTSGPEYWFPKLVMIRLNGGLGSSMGLDRPKSLLLVRKHETFLDLVVAHLLWLRSHVKGQYPYFYLMNSYISRAPSLRLILSKYPEIGPASDLDFMQNWVPRLSIDTLEPVKYPENPELEWCSPGHGDFYVSIYTSGLLDRLLKRGVKYAFIANCENVAATPDLRIVDYMEKNQIDYVMEVTYRLPIDQYVGQPLIWKNTGRFTLREAAQVHPEELNQVYNPQRHPFFNTNNIWINLLALKELLHKYKGILPLPIVLEKRLLDPLKPEAGFVYHLETSIGAGIELFDRALLIEVPRTRYLAIKTTADLLAVRSDVYELGKDHRLIISSLRAKNPPLIKLDERFYSFLDKFERFFPKGAPSLIKCGYFCVIGPVMFMNPVVCEGEKVIFVNSTDQIAQVLPGVYTTGEYIVSKGV